MPNVVSGQLNRAISGQMQVGVDDAAGNSPYVAYTVRVQNEGGIAVTSVEGYIENDVTAAAFNGLARLQILENLFLPSPVAYPYTLLNASPDIIPDLILPLSVRPTDIVQRVTREFVSPFVLENGKNYTIFWLFDPGLLALTPRTVLALTVFGYYPGGRGSAQIITR